MDNQNDFQNILNFNEIIKTQEQLLDLQGKILNMLSTLHISQENSTKNRHIDLSNVSDSEAVVRVGDFAEMIKKRGVPYGRNKIHSWLNNRGYTYREDDRNYPNIEYIEGGLFKVKEYVVNRKSGAKIESTIYLTPKGVSYFMEKILNEFNIKINLEEK